MKQIEDEYRECEALQISLKDLTRQKVRLEKYSSSQRNIAITSKSIKGKKKDILETKERMKQTEKIHSEQMKLLEERLITFSNDENKKFMEKLNDLQQKLKHEKDSIKKEITKNEATNGHCTVQDMEHNKKLGEKYASRLAIIKESTKINRAILEQKLKNVLDQNVAKQKKEKEFYNEQITELNMRLNPIWYDLEQKISMKVKSSKKLLHSEMTIVHMIDLLKSDIYKLQRTADKLRSQLFEG